jgi:hypothetical protein
MACFGSEQRNTQNCFYLLETALLGLAPRQAWLAVAFIEANWDKPLTV